MFGVCQQQNILTNILTAEEQLLFFGGMKGTQSDKLESEVKILLIGVQLYENRSIRSENLSGGQKRKLCNAVLKYQNPNLSE